MNCLIVDDDASFAELLSLVLPQAWVGAVAIVGDGREALRHLEGGQTPDVLLCDLNMPRMDGVQLVGRLAELGFRGHLILFSGTDWRVLKTCEELARAKGLRVAGALRKPFDLQELTTLLTGLEAGDAPSPAPLEQVSPTALAAALAEGRVLPWFQAQVTPDGTRLRGVEALARWERPGQVPVSPLAFVPVAEEHGLADALLETIARPALARVAGWRGRAGGIGLSLNLSEGNLHGPDLPERLEDWTRAAGLTPAAVTLELTESRVLHSLTRAQEVLTRLRLKGFGIAIDDFGTGFATLERLHHLPFTELKVDRRFVHGVAEDARSRAVLEASVQLAHRLGMEVVAEGVERDADLALVAASGCDLVQGYRWCRPLDAAGFGAWLATRPAP